MAKGKDSSLNPRVIVLTHTLSRESLGAINTQD